MKLTIEIQTDDRDDGLSVADVLTAFAVDIAAGIIDPDSGDGRVYDRSGNRVGYWEWR